VLYVLHCQLINCLTKQKGLLPSVRLLHVARSPADVFLYNHVADRPQQHGQMQIGAVKIRWLCCVSGHVVVCLPSLSKQVAACLCSHVCSKYDKITLLSSDTKQWHTVSSWSCNLSSQVNHQVNHQPPARSTCCLLQPNNTANFCCFISCALLHCQAFLALMERGYLLTLGTCVTAAAGRTNMAQIYQQQEISTARGVAFCCCKKAAGTVLDDIISTYTQGDTYKVMVCLLIAALTGAVRHSADLLLQQ
jgi:hypothetical protein